MAKKMILLFLDIFLITPIKLVKVTFIYLIRALVTLYKFLVEPVCKFIKHFRKQLYLTMVNALLYQKCVYEYRNSYEVAYRLDEKEVAYRLDDYIVNFKMTIIMLVGMFITYCGHLHKVIPLDIAQIAILALGFFIWMFIVPSISLNITLLKYLYFRLTSLIDKELHS